MKHNNNLSLFSHSIMKFRKSQELSKSLNDNDLHPLLVGHFDPDVRPFTWPRRKRKQDPELKQEKLFNV